MARPIKETPILYGNDAIRFLDEMKKTNQRNPIWKKGNVLKTTLQNLSLRQAYLRISMEIKRFTDNHTPKPFWNFCYVLVFLKIINLFPLSLHNSNFFGR